MKYRENVCKGCKHSDFKKCRLRGKFSNWWWPGEAICELGHKVKWEIAEDCPDWEFDYEPFRQRSLLERAVRR